MSIKTDCIFCKIIAGEIPGEVVYENEHFLAFCDITPQAPGHVQVVPKRHYRWVWDLPTSSEAGPDEPSAGAYFETAQTIARAQQKAFDTDWIISKIVGEEVEHAHIWVFPGDAEGDKNDIEGNAQKIRKTLNE